MTYRQSIQGVAYLRSNEGNDTKIAAQRALIVQWAAQAGIQIVSWHQDEADGLAAISRRPGLCSALAELQAREAKVLVVAQPHDLTRSFAQMAEVTKRLRAVGAVLRSADESTCWPLLESLLPSLSLD